MVRLKYIRYRLLCFLCFLCFLFPCFTFHNNKTPPRPTTFFIDSAPKPPLMGCCCSRHRRNHHHHRYNHSHYRQNQNPSLPSSNTNTTTTTSSFNTNNDQNMITNTNSLTQNNPRPTNPIPPNAPYLPSRAPPTPTIPLTLYNSHNYPLPSPPPPPPPPPPIPFNPLSSGWVRHHSPNMAPWLPPRPASPRPPPPPYVDFNHAKTIKNDVNVHKDSIRIVLDDNNTDDYLVSFTFDALVDGSITIFYLAKEEANCTFVPLYPDIYTPRKIPFKKGRGQKFSQPSGSGIDLGFFELDHLSKPSPEEDIFPLVISVEAGLPSLSTDAESDQPLPIMSSRAQITQAVLEKNNEGHFQVKVVKQLLWIDGVRYEVREIYGIGNSEEAGFDDSESGGECVICMTEPKDTAVFPCRHMCLCSGCAKEFRLISDKCPICREPIQELVEIKLNKDHPPT